LDTELSFEQVVNVYTSTVYSVALTHTATRADADDVFQEVFVAYWKSNPELTSEEHRKAWLIRTTLNQSLKITQSSWTKKTVYTDGGTEVGTEGRGYCPTQEWDSNPVPQSQDPVPLSQPQSQDPVPDLDAFTDFPFQTEQQEALYAAIRTLPAAYRTVVMLFYFEDLSIAQIAAALEEEQGTVKTRLSRARAQLRNRLEEGVGDE